MNQNAKLYITGGETKTAYTMNPVDLADKLKVITEEKDLGVTFSRDLKFSTHVAKAANKGNQVIGAIRHSFRNMYKDMLTQLYKCKVMAG